MKEFLAYIYPYIEKIVEIGTTLAKFSLGVGVILITWYFIYIRYFPTDMELGDGLLFMMLSFKFMILLLLFLISHYALGKTIEKILISCKGIFIFFKAPIANAKLLVSKISLEKFEKSLDRYFLYICYTIVAVFLMLILFYFYEDTINSNLKSILINSSLFIVYTACILKIVDSTLQDFKKNSDNSDNSKNKKILFKVMFLFFLPISYIMYYQSDSESKFLLFSSSLVRETNNNKITIYVKKDYISFFEKKRPHEAKGSYIPVDEVEVVLRGVGKNALLRQKKQIGKNIEVQKIEIPNDSILIVRKD
ncbi:hypothetical protein ACG9XQ_10770 [Acinetobacter baumannii]|uniref:hypothetical protein n=1 Tax=Acinetobacter baumannii TaxID=470 RepID=UPI003AF4A189